MKEYEIVSKVFVYDWEELSDVDRRLLQTAKDATYNSYAPYSHFHVGAAALLQGGEIFSGSNQENAAYPSGLCAERTALFAANAHFPDRPVLALAIAARMHNKFSELPISPCGACRQVICEVEDRFRQPIRILLYGTAGVHVVSGIQDLLPLRFVDADMRFT